MPDLITVAEARTRVLAAVRPLPAVPVPITDALRRVLAEEIVAPGDVPPFASSAMDGFAIVAGPADRRLMIVGEARAGKPAQRPVADGEAIAISTGAVVPDGATAVLRVEDSEQDGTTVTLGAATEVGQNIRGAGDDLRAGELVLAVGAVLDAPSLGITVSSGRAVVACAGRPRVAVLSTGDELIAAGTPLAPGQIHNSNAVMLAALVEQAGGEAIRADPVADDPAATRTAISAALDAADVVVVTGGVSVGPHDHVKAAFVEAGAEERFWRVALRPGKPVWFGARGPALAFGLPGNPVSAVVCFHLFVAPALRALQGASPLPERRTARLARPVRRNPHREEAARVSLSGGADGLLAEVTGPQGSHQLTSMLGADALAFIGAGEGEAAAGDVVEIELLCAGG